MKSYKINTTNLKKISELLDLVAERCRPILETIATKRLADSTAFYFDQLWDSESHIDESALTRARTELLTRQNSARNSPDSNFGLDVEVTVLSPKTTLVSFISPHIEALSEEVENCASQLNLKLTEAKYTSTQTTLRAISINNFLPKCGDIVEYLPSFEERCNHAAHNGCFVKFLDEVSEHSQITTRAVEDFRDWLQTEEGQASFEAALNYCNRTLKRTLKNSDL